ncbi:hypothetical protein TWF694_008168 [Orbilia ellipsospora]|uniref:DUF7029 domain-containing protein n=1 Tax=Orbilia ellipsospora TaxID=2528407 RepID=A0AAV9XFT8_9PEZI
MVSSKLISLAITSGFLVLQTHAAAIRNNIEPASTGNERKSVLMKPLRHDELFPNLQKRSDDHSKLNLQHEVKMTYMGINSQQQAYVAEMKIEKSHPDHPLILLEDFDHLTQDISCTDNKLSLKFNSQEMMDHAIKTWNWVNDRDYFYLITHHHHKGCGPDEERAPYKIVAVEEHRDSLTTILTKEKTTWKEAAQKYEIKFETVEHPDRVEKRESPSLATRIHQLLGCDGILAALLPHCVGKEIAEAIPKLAPEVIKGIEDILRKAQGRVQTSFGYHKGQKGVRKPIYSTKGMKGNPDGFQYGADITCVGCYISGNFGIALFIKGDPGAAANVGMELTPHLEGQLAFELAGKISYVKDFNAIDILVAKALDTLVGQPEAPVVSGIIKLAPEVLNGPGFTIGGSASANLTAGFSFNTGASKIVAGLGGQGATALGQWSDKDVQVKKILEVGSASATFEITPYYRIGFGLGIELMSGVKVLGGYKFGAWAGLKASANYAVTGVYSSRGNICKNNPKSTTAKKINSVFKVEAGYKVINSIPTNTLLRKLTANPSSSFTPLYTHPFKDTCDA